MDGFMTPRLYAIASMVPQGAFFADVGTDHAYLPIYLAENNLISHAVAADINRGPLLRAKGNIKKYNLEEKIDTCLSDGFEELDGNSFDTASIAGMGGILIARILEKAPRGKLYILQPMRDAHFLRAYLSSNGFELVDEKLAEEGNKIYTVIAVRDGKEVLSEKELYLGKLLKKDPLFEKFRTRLSNKYKKKYEGLKLSSTDKTAEIEECERIINILNGG